MMFARARVCVCAIVCGVEYIHPFSASLFTYAVYRREMSHAYGCICLSLAALAWPVNARAEKPRNAMNKCEQQRNEKDIWEHKPKHTARKNRARAEICAKDDSEQQQQAQAIQLQVISNTEIVGALCRMYSLALSRSRSPWRTRRK